VDTAIAGTVYSSEKRLFERYSLAQGGKNRLRYKTYRLVRLLFRNVENVSDFRLCLSEQVRVTRNVPRGNRKSSENMANFKYLGIIARNQNAFTGEKLRADIGNIG
jgi:hypothetical protein